MVTPSFGVYVPLGYPDPETFSELLGLLPGAVDFVEVGVPSPRPKYDGPTIRRIHLDLVSRGSPSGLEAFRELPRPPRGLTAIVMAYLEDVGVEGLGEAASLAASKGYSSLLLPDLAFDYPGEVPAYVEAVRSAGMRPCFFASSKFPHNWLVRYAANAPLFVYLGLQPSTGVRLPISVCRNVRLARRILGGVVLLAGFSVRTPGDAASLIRCGADAVVVGTRFLEVLSDRGVGEAVEYAREMRRAVHSAG